MLLSHRIYEPFVVLQFESVVVKARSVQEGKPGPGVELQKQVGVGLRKALLHPVAPESDGVALVGVLALL